MNVSLIDRQQRKVLFQVAFLVSFLFLIVLAYNVMNGGFEAVENEMSVMNDQFYGKRRNVQQHSLRRNGKRQKSQKRLPDVIIVGVKKSGTITLTKFLNYHPSIAAAGEISFFEKGYSFNIKRIFLHELFLFLDEKFNKGIDFYRNKMPRARADQVVLVKARNCKL